MIWEAASFRGAAFFCCYLLKPENIFYLCIIMKNVLFCILMIYVVCGCRSQQPQEIVRLAVKSLDELQSVSAVLVSNAAFDGAELSDELASRIPFLFKQVVRDSGTYFFTFEQIDNRVFYRNDQPYMACVYLDMLLGTRIPVEPGAKRYDYFARIQEELDLMQQILDGKKLREVASDSSRIVDVGVERAPDTLFNGQDCYVLKRHNDVTLIPSKSNNESWKANVRYKVMHSYNTYALFIEKHTGLPVYWSYTNSGDQDGRKIPGNRNTEFLENMELKDIPDSCFYPAQADKIRYVASFDEFVQEVKVGDEAPAYELTDVMTGKVYSNASLQGKIVVMQFTSTGCVGCVLAQPWMNKLYDRWKEQPELVFLCAGLLSEKDAKIQVEKYEFAYPMTTCNQAFFWSFGVQAIPSYYVIGKDNQVLARPQSHIGLKNFLDSYFNK